MAHGCSDTGIHLLSYLTICESETITLFNVYIVEPLLVTLILAVTTLLLDRTSPTSILIIFLSVLSFIFNKVSLSKHLILGILKLVLTFNTSIINANIIDNGTAIATKITVFAIAAPHVKGIIQKIATITASTIKIIIKN